jgi:hypothetical protein
MLEVSHNLDELGSLDLVAKGNIDDDESDEPCVLCARVRSLRRLLMARTTLPQIARLLS